MENGIKRSSIKADSHCSISTRPIRAPFAADANATSRFAALFCLRVLLAHESAFDLKRDADDLLAVVGDFLAWPETLVPSIHKALEIDKVTDVKARASKRLSPRQVVEACAFGNHNRNRSGFSDAFFHVYRSRTREVKEMIRCAASELEHAIEEVRDPVFANIGMLAELVHLSPAEDAVLTFAVTKTYSGSFRQLLALINTGNNLEGQRILASGLNVPHDTLTSALKARGRLLEYGLITVDHTCRDIDDICKVSEAITSRLTSPNASIPELVSQFIDEAPSGTLAVDDFPHMEEDFCHLLGYIKSAAATRDQGVNILLYGKPGTGKTEFARLLTKEAGLRLYEVASADTYGDAPSSRERYASLRISQQFLGELKDVAMLFDEAEDVFGFGEDILLGGMPGRSSAGRGRNTSKAWVNRLLETNSIPTIWVTNSIGQMDEAYLRRFRYHLEFRTPPTRVRTGIARKYLEPLALNETFIADLVRREHFTPAQLESAATFARAASDGDPGKMEMLVLRQLRNSNQAVGRGPKPGPSRKPADYSLEFINVAAPNSVDGLVNSLSRMNAGSLLFHGASGTGKTSLAEYISDRLGRPLKLKTASDLLSKWVGETEQLIAESFREAEREQAILFIDEADSFLRDRRHAERTWEVSQVNELLQQMERFNGILICATNLFGDMDTAVLRRFALKVEFLPLNRDQRLAMFTCLSSDGTPVEVSPRIANRLASLSQLTPGDFALVKRQLELLGISATVDDFMAHLEAEHCLKASHGEGNRIGFL